MASTVGVYQIRYRLAALSVVYLLNAIAGTWLGIARNLPGRPLGLRTGVPVGSDFVFGLGTALSAPLILLLSLVALNWRMVRRPDLRATRWIGILGVGFLVGMVFEPTLGEALRGSHDPMIVAAFAGNLAVPGALVAVGLATSHQFGVNVISHRPESRTRWLAGLPLVISVALWGWNLTTLPTSAY